MDDDRYCVECAFYDGRHYHCEKWNRTMPPMFRMTPEHDCPYWIDLFDWAEAQSAVGRAEMERRMDEMRRSRINLSLGR